MTLTYFRLWNPQHLDDGRFCYTFFDKYLRIVISRVFTMIILYPYELLMALHM